MTDRADDPFAEYTMFQNEFPDPERLAKPWPRSVPAPGRGSSR
ncbi:hypothetical protein [Nocardia sp. NPDC050435]